MVTIEVNGSRFCQKLIYLVGSIDNIDELNDTKIERALFYVFFVSHLEGFCCLELD